MADNVFTKALNVPFADKVRRVEIENCSVTYDPTEVQFVSRAQINALSLCVFFDYTDTAKITEAGDYVTQINSQNSGDIVWGFSSNTAFKMVNISATAPGIQSFAAWHWGGDTSAPNTKPGSNQNHSHLSMILVRTGTVERRIFDDDAFYHDLFITGTGGVKLNDHTYNVSLTQNVPYILSFTKTTDVYVCSATQLTTPFTVQTDEHTDQEFAELNNKDHKITWGDAQFGGQNFQWGSWAILKGNNESDITLLQNFLKQQFTGVGENASAASQLSIYLNSRYLTRRYLHKFVVDENLQSDRIVCLHYTLDLEQKPVYRLERPKLNATTPFLVDDIDFYFSDKNGKILPTRFECEINFLK